MQASLSFVDRFKMAAVVWAVFMLVVGIADAFVDTSVIRNLVFHSTIFWVSFTGIALLAAPLIATIVPVRTESGRNFGPWGLMLIAVAVLVIGVTILVEVIRH